MKLKKLVPNAQMPTKGTPGSACYDLYAVRDQLCPRGKVTGVSTGLAMEIPEGFCAVGYSRSSMFYRNGVVEVPLVVDSDYRGEVLVMLMPQAHDYQVRAGDRVAQFKLERVRPVVFEFTGELTPTDRGAGGYGSTGR